MQRLYVGEAVLGLLPCGDFTVRTLDADADPVPVEGGEGILQADPELAYDLVRLGELLPVLVLGEVLIAKPSPPVTDMPAPLAVLEDLRLSGPGERLLVESVRDHLAKRVRHGPVLQHALDVEIELTSHAGSS